MSAPDEDLIRLAIRTKGDRIRLKEACRIVYAANSLLRSLDIRGEEERSFLFSSSFGKNYGSCQKKRRSRSSGAVGSSNRRTADEHGLVSLCVF